MNTEQAIVLDTNILVAAGFNPHSSAARIVQAVRTGDMQLVWHPRTHAEAKKIIRQIPSLSWGRFEDLFTPDGKYEGAIVPEAYPMINDYDDRKFAALAAATGAILVSNDRHLLSVRERLPITVLSAQELAHHAGA